jgi:serine/threonine protein kinase
MRLDELRRLRKLLTDAASPMDVFMSLRDRSLQGDARSLALAAEVRRLQSLANPERFMGNPPAQDLAREIQSRLAELYDAALQSLDQSPAVEVEAVEAVEAPAELHDAPASMQASVSRLDAGFSLTIGDRSYTLERALAQGDVATLHRGRCTTGPHAGAEVVAKVAQEPADDAFILAEIQALGLLHRGEGAQRNQLPAVLDLFHGTDGRAGVLLSWLDGFNGVDLRGRFARGVPPEHVIWIGRRLLSAAGYAHSLGVLHGNIEPAHIIVRPRDHHVALIDWCYAIVEPARTHQGFRAYNPQYSGPEVASKKSPVPASDLFSIGRVLLYLLGGDLESGDMPDDVDARLQRFVRYLTRTSPLQRAQDAWEMFSELGRLRGQIYGAHRFQEFVVP